ncbi:MAG: single-stranded DNA-binding protein [Candidatus Margulisiibacteriota bacterium]
MNDLNECYLIGRAVDDVKIDNYGERIKYSFIVAINYYSLKKKQEFSDFIPVAFWRNKPLKELEQLKKGDSVATNGRVSINTYEMDGIKRVSTQLVANYVKVFKLSKETNNMDDLIKLIKSNKELLEAIKSSSDIQLSEAILAELSEK